MKCEKNEVRKVENELLYSTCMMEKRSISVPKNEQGTKGISKFKIMKH
jgi:hypothetical protein